MKLKYTFLTGLFAAVTLTACVSENTDNEPVLSGDSGKMALTVSTLEPTATRANTQVYDFPVTVKDAEGTTIKSYERADAVPSTVVLAVGNYTVESHTPGEIQKRMTAPYYYGTADMLIEKDITTNVDVVCKMLNSSIQMIYDADFISLFTAWSITLDDGGQTALSFTSEDGTNPGAVYWYFEDGAETLTLQFNGTTTAGNSVTATRQLSKNDAAVSQYDDDKSNFSGGDIVVVNFTPVESTSGTVTGITINANVTFSETDTTIPVDVTDAGLTDDPNQGNDPGQGGEPQTGDAITLTLPSNMTVSGSTDPSLGDTYIKCNNGIKSIKVSIDSSSSDMMSSLSDLNENYGVDFVSGAEVVGNQDLVSLFTDLGQTLTVPTQGDTEYTFPIGNFFGLLVFLSGDHTFNLVIEDMNGNKKNGTLTLTVE